jgi:hypothetical protein
MIITFFVYNIDVYVYIYMVILYNSGKNMINNHGCW